MEYRDKIAVSFVVMALVLGLAFGMVITNALQEEQDCPDCNLICPDVIDYGEDYDDILSEILQRLNDTEEFDEQAILKAIYNMERNITYDISWLEYDHDWMDYTLSKIRNDTMYWSMRYQYPQDAIAPVNYTTNTSFQLEYYDNINQSFSVSPMFYFDDWTLMVNWADSQGIRLTQYQQMMIIALAMGIAYYNETGAYPPLG
ncbi:MAG: hypothetical protein ACXABY_22710 [Candidatus Thorarchaeota archaeon]